MAALDYNAVMMKAASLLAVIEHTVQWDMYMVFFGLNEERQEVMLIINPYRMSYSLEHDKQTIEAEKQRLLAA